LRPFFSKKERRTSHDIGSIKAGQPNCGKSTVFNALTGASQHVANYPGVTVYKMIGRYKHNGTRVEVVGLPGTYSLTSYSPEERVSRDFILHENPSLPLSRRHGWISNRLGCGDRPSGRNRPSGQTLCLWTGNVFWGTVKGGGRPVPYAEIEVEYMNHRPLTDKNAFAKEASVEAPQDAMAGWWNAIKLIAKRI
jgi:hypothetical protein